MTHPVSSALVEALGEDRVLVDPIELVPLARDMGDPPALLRRLLGGEGPAFAVRPRTPQELATAVGLLAREGVPMTPRGLGSAGLGGAVPVAGGAVLDLSWLQGMVSVDSHQRTAVALAGTPFFFLDRALEPHGLGLPCRPSNAFGTVGGWAAAGGIGLGSLGAGPLRDQVAAIEVVLPDGSLDRLRPEDSGYADFFDTEGQLGVFASLELRLLSRAERAPITGVRLPDLDAAQAWLAAQEGARTVFLAGTADELGLDGHDEIGLVEGPVPEGEALPASVAHRLWSRRFFPMDNPLGPVFLAGEALVPVDAVAGYVARARQLGHRFGVPIHTHVHTARMDGQLVALVLAMFPSDPRQPRHHLLLSPLAAVLVRAAIAAGGVPYGVGLWNTPFARVRFGAERFATLERRKRAVDPAGRLNPGKLFRVGAGSGLLSTTMSSPLYPPALGLAATGAPLLMHRHDPSALPSTTAERCISCGACVPVCPAVVATGAESVSARAKLALMKRLAAGEQAADEELLGSQRCLKCGQCEEVCARSLALVDAWEELEAMVRERVDGEQLVEVIRAFADQVDDGDVLGVAL